jgi:hypothetical protein
LVSQERASLVCIKKTELVVIDDFMMCNMLVRVFRTPFFLRMELGEASSLLGVLLCGRPFIATGLSMLSP